ncbi:MAG: vanadium-dependent haloperoxidase, partial [Chloroflexota bacterium]
ARPHQVEAVALQAKSVQAAELSGIPAAEWAQLVYKRVFAEKVSAPAGGRLYAYAGIAMHEAVVPGIEGGKSLSGQVTDLPPMPAIDETLAYDWIASLAGTMSVVVPGIFPGSADTQTAVQLLRDQQINARKREVDADIVDRSVAYGESVGKLIMDWEAKDNAKEAHDKGTAYVIPAGQLDAYVLTTANTKPVEPFWGTVRVFGLPNSAVCDAKQDMDFSDDPKSTFYAQALEVKNVGDKLTKEQKDIATFWVDTPGITGTPGGHWVALTAQLIGDLKLDLGRSVDALAMVGIGVGDAFISGWNIKYVVLLMRPETYIHKYIDPKWQPFIQTPPFPEFVSGHSIVSETAARILTDIFGTMSFTDNTERFRNLDSRSFTSFENAASEAGISRLYGGIHYRTGIEKGFDEGRCVAASIIDRIKVR